MNADVNSTTALRQWKRSRCSSGRTSPSSSQSSSSPSRPATPSGSMYKHLHPQFWQRSTNYPDAVSIEECLKQKSLGGPEERSILPSSRSPLEEVHLQSDDYQVYIERSRSRTRTQTVTPASVRRVLQPDSDRMRIPFPGTNQRDSTTSITSIDSRPSRSSSDSGSAYDEELGGIPASHPLRNQVNSKGSTLLFNGAEDILGSPTTSPYSHTHTSGTDSPASFSSSLRLKPKKSYSHRGAMTLLKSLASSPTPESPQKPQDIEFDWANQRRKHLEQRAKLLEQESKAAHSATGPLSQTGIEIRCSTADDDDETQETAPIRPKSWELTPEELALRNDQKREEEKRFIFKDHVWINRSYVSAHSRDAVPYPLAYDSVNIQTDRYSHALVKELLCGRPSIHDDVSKKPPAVVLDLGCGDGTWILEAAQCWRTTRFYGLDLQNLHPSHQQLQSDLGELADNLKFTYYNFLLDKLPYLDEKFDLVRMANLKWAIPEDKWDFVLQEVNRVLRRGGWVEIIDDDFLLSTSSHAVLSPEQRIACDTLETQFMGMLQVRNLLVNTGGHFMDEKVSRWFNAFHEDVFPITISKARPVSLEINGQGPVQVLLPGEGMSQKAAKLMGFGLDPIHDKHRSAGTTRSRSRSGSVSSGVSSSSGVSGSSSRVVERDDNHSEVHYQYRHGAEKQRTYQPYGLDVHPGRFIPFPPDELNAHAIRNMQMILGSKEAIRAHNLRKCAELEALEIKEDLLPDERQRFDELSCEWNDQQCAFDDVFWDFETAMLKRLNLPQRCWDVDDDNEHPHKSLSTLSRSHLQHPPSGLHKVNKNGDGLPSPIRSTFSTNSHVPARFIRVYSGWK